MTETSMADRWRDLYSVAHSNPTAVDTLVCPCCGVRALQLVFLVPFPGEKRGIFYFWCDNCLNGLAPNTVLVPPDGIRIPMEGNTVPNYTLVQD